MFTSDNGPWLNYGDHAGSSGGLREGKATAWEGGNRVPCIARWPARIPAGTTCDRTICLTDLLATCAGIVDQPIGPEAGEDSVDVLPLLAGEVDEELRSDLESMGLVIFGNVGAAQPHQR